jgi:thiol-disulfide isomerase/thioredoxin
MYEAVKFEDIENLKKHNKPVVIVFGAEYCPTCVNYMPYIEHLYYEYKCQVIIRFIDTSKNETIRKIFNIELIPSTIFYDREGRAYKPSDNISVDQLTETIEERKYLSDTLKPVYGEKIGAHPNFEFGLNDDGEIMYSKYVGLLTITQLNQILNEIME